MDMPLRILVFLLGLVVVISTLFSALSTFVLPRSARSFLNRILFGLLRRISDYFDIPYPSDPHFPETTISISRDEFESVLDRLQEAGLPLKTDWEQAWRNFAGWRVNYDHTLLTFCGLVMGPPAFWSSDRTSRMKLPPLFLPRKK